MKRIFLFTIITTLFLVSCDNATEKEDKNLLIKNIKQLEIQYFSTENYQPKKADFDSLISLYSNYIETFNDDSLTVTYMIKKANILVIVKNYKEAVTIYNDININHADSKYAPDALFYEAMIYGDNLKNEVMAEKKYKEFIEKYPNNEFRDDAENSIKLLGMSDEEIMQMILKNDTNNLNKIN